MDKLHKTITNKNGSIHPVLIDVKNIYFLDSIPLQFTETVPTCHSGVV